MARSQVKINEDEHEVYRAHKRASINSTDKSKPIRRVQSERTPKSNHQRLQQVFKEAPAPLQHSPSRPSNLDLRRYPTKFHIFSTDTDSELSHYQTFQQATRQAHRQQQIDDMLDELDSSSSKQRWSSSQHIMKETVRQQQRKESFEKTHGLKHVSAGKGVVFSEFAELEF